MEPIFIRSQDKLILLNVSHAARIEVEGLSVVAYDAQGKRVYLGEYVDYETAQRALSQISGWINNHAGPLNPIFVMPAFRGERNEQSK